MSAVYKVMEQMQKSRPNRMRANGFMFAAFGAAIFLLCYSVPKAGFMSYMPPDPAYPSLQMPLADNSLSTCHGGVGAAVILSLSPDGEWFEAYEGKVSEAQLRDLMISRRDRYRSQGWRADVAVRIGAGESAKHIKRIYKISEQCEMNGLLVGTWGHDPKGS